MFSLFIYGVIVFFINYAIRIYRHYYHDHVKWATGDRFSKTQKMSFDTFSKTYFMSKQLACFYHRAYGETIKPASISGKLRHQIKLGKVAESLDAYGAKVYWLV